MKWTIPNILTLFRIALIPVFILTFFSEIRIIALAVFIVAFVTDILDGYIARKTNTETPFGRWADPLADKLMTITAIACLSVAHNLPWCLLPVYCVMALIMGIGAVVAYLGKRKIEVEKSNLIGKAAMGGTSIGICLSFFASQISPWHIIIMWISAAVGVVAIACYFAIYCKKIRELTKNAN